MSLVFHPRPPLRPLMAVQVTAATAARLPPPSRLSPRRRVRSRRSGSVRALRGWSGCDFMSDRGTREWERASACPPPTHTGDLLDRLEAGGPAFVSPLRVLRSLGDTDAAVRALPADLLAQGWVWETAAAAMAGRSDYESAVLSAAATYVVQALPGAEAATAAASVAPLASPLASTILESLLQRSVCALGCSIGGSVALYVPAESSSCCATGGVLFPPTSYRSVSDSLCRVSLGEGTTAFAGLMDPLNCDTTSLPVQYQPDAVASSCVCPVLLAQPAEASCESKENSPSGRGIMTGEIAQAVSCTDSSAGAQGRSRFLLVGAASHDSQAVPPVQTWHGDSVSASRPILGDITTNSHWQKLSVRSEADCQSLLELPLYSLAAPRCNAASRHRLQVRYSSQSALAPLACVYSTQLPVLTGSLMLADMDEMQNIPASYCQCGASASSRDVDSDAVSRTASCGATSTLATTAGRPRLGVDNLRVILCSMSACELYRDWHTRSSVVAIHGTASVSDATQTEAGAASGGGEHDRVAQPEPAYASDGTGSASVPEGTQECISGRQAASQVGTVTVAATTTSHALFCRGPPSAPSDSMTAIATCSLQVSRTTKSTLSSRFQVPPSLSLADARLSHHVSPGLAMHEPALASSQVVDSTAMYFGSGRLASSHRERSSSFEELEPVAAPAPTYHRNTLSLVSTAWCCAAFALGMQYLLRIISGP